MQMQGCRTTQLSPEVAQGFTLRHILLVATGGVRPRFAHEFRRLAWIVVTAIWSSFLFVPAVSGDKTSALNIDWKKFSSVSKTDVTLQVVENPKLQRSSDIHDCAWATLRDLNSDFVRFALWFPYPRLAVAELN